MMRLARTAAGYGAWLAASVPVAWAAGEQGCVTAAVPATIQAAFAPWDNLEEAIVGAIGEARHRILMQAYLFSSRKIAAALVDARRRGVQVSILMDAEQLSKGASSLAPELLRAGILIWLETNYQNAHNKILVIDPGAPDAVVITGSYNFTWTANHKNAENILIIRRHPKLAACFAMNWERHRRDATPFKQ